MFINHLPLPVTEFPGFDGLYRSGGQHDLDETLASSWARSAIVPCEPRETFLASDAYKVHAVVRILVAKPHNLLILHHFMVLR